MSTCNAALGRSRAPEACGVNPAPKISKRPCGTPAHNFYQDIPPSQPPDPDCEFGRTEGPCTFDALRKHRHRHHRRYHRRHRHHPHHPHHHHHHHHPAHAECAGECRPCPVPLGCGVVDNVIWPDRGPCEPPPMLPCGEEKQPGYRQAPCTVGDQPKPPPCREEKALICKLPLSPATKTLLCYERKPKTCVDKTPELCGTMCTCYAPEFPTDKMIEDAARVRAYHREEASWIRERIWPPPSSPPPLLITVPKPEPPKFHHHHHHGHHGHPCLPLHQPQECPEFEQCLIHHRGGSHPTTTRPFILNT